MSSRLPESQISFGLVAWLATQAESLGVDVFAGFASASNKRAKEVAPLGIELEGIV